MQVKSGQEHHHEAVARITVKRRLLNKWLKRGAPGTMRARTLR